MAAPPTPVTASLTGPEVRKLRSSCDGCGSAKVKCDRGQPECARCVALGLTCAYGRSRQFGKPPRKRPGSTLDASASLSNKKRAIHTAENVDIHTTMGFRRPQSITEPAQLDFSDMVTDILPMSSGINTILNIDEQNHLGPGLFMPMSFDEWPQLGILGTNLNTPCITKASASDIRLSASALDPASTARTNSNNHESHSCPRESYEILADLICPGPSLHAPVANSDTVSTQMDHVLHFNRNAIDRLSRVLKCPCAKSGHRVMVHASIISRILIWYQQAAGWNGNDSWGPQISASADSSTSHRSSSSPLSGTAAGTAAPSLTQSTGFAVADVPVSVGTFNIEDQNLQAAVRNQLVLSELKKAASLIDLFTSQDSEETSASGEASLYSYLGAWLRSEHAKIVRILRSRLNVLNEDDDS
ncbi:hypothetical protein G7Z17_g2632 [Cylindrodendrum hubeiense]|uniref:Zn(2)-C6 fungal-type domain-containing protein n=1 Tax=Cylindrodendrum hubeiense TaxID=595255 RepID=A0A9P5HMT0_9HYPO|nr:hypothetical protein G7Z17_g2632 [Cylindrodendrum hubeiense]